MSKTPSDPLGKKENGERSHQVPMDGLPKVPAVWSAKLDGAWRRYLVAVGVVTPDVVVAAESSDRDLYEELRVRGQAWFMREPLGAQVEFMHRITALPRSWCATWCYLDLAHTVVRSCSPSSTPNVLEPMYVDVRRMVREDQMRGFRVARGLPRDASSAAGARERF